MSAVNKKNVIHVISLSLLFESVFILSCIPVALIYSENTAFSLFVSFLIVLGIGLFGFFFSKKNNEEFTLKETFISVVLTWITISILGSLPYILSGAITKFDNAFFETVSGFTTTGASILTDIEVVPKSILFWRAETHWIGGMGIIVLVIAFLPFFKVGGQNLMMAEGSFFNSEKIKSRTIDVAKRMWFIYLILTISQVVLLTLSGMDLFDSICHSFATIATGGFSTKNSSIIDYSPTIQYIVIIFMTLSGMNFTLHYLFFHGKLKRIFKNEEFVAYLAIILISSLLIMVIIKTANGFGWEKSFRDAIFQVSSLITATGFVSSNYELWPHSAQWILFLLMLIGACVGSTGGGIKVARYVIAFKNLKSLILRTIYPNSVYITKYNGRAFSQDISAGIISYIFIYYLTILFGTVILVISGLDKVSACGAVTTTLGGVGPGFNEVGPIDNFSAISSFGKYYLSFNMILGRLEIMSFLVILVPSFYRK